MSLSYRQFLLLFLAMLQLFAPLLHAHAGQSRHFGFHIPGLEFYFGHQVGHSAIQPEHTLSNADDLIVAVNDGIRENRAQAESDPLDDCWIPLLKAILGPIAAPTLFKIHFTPPLPPSRTRLPTQSQRAPPVL
ncbi:MAG: hypothetical protein ACU841_06640 [Gammaproteobacteria bacterium]